uniref:Reverse transcriptase Ty1/copia-type domain-containing protein n=1 Tax=Fagus sylvatica TaxID=28930 RepID=A0A2N9IVB0_FAGSY
MIHLLLHIFQNHHVIILILSPDPLDSLVQLPDTSCQSPTQPSNSPVSDLPTSLPSLPKPTLPLRHSSRPKHTPSYLQDYHCNLASSIPPPNSSTMYPIDHTISYSHLSPAHKAYTLAISTLVEPRFYHEAVSSPHWCEAMDKELAALEVNHTLVLTALPSGKHLIGCKWVYNIKFKSDGSIERLTKSLYGLKQASRQWFSKFSSTIIAHGFQQSKCDYYLFTKTEGSTFIGLLVYVDDILIASNNPESVKVFTAFLDQKFKLKDFGPAKYFLGLELARSHKVSCLSQFMSEPRLPHLHAAHKIGQVALTHVDPLLVSAFSWETLLISWRSKKQTIVSRSFAEAEYRAMVIATFELTWLLALLQDFVFHTQQLQFSSVTIRLPSTLQLILVFHERTKHIEVDCHFIQDKIQDGLLKTLHVSSSHQLADIFTKPFGFVQFSHLLSKLGVVNIHSPT